MIETRAVSRPGAVPAGRRSSVPGAHSARCVRSNSRTASPVPAAYVPRFVSLGLSVGILLGLAFGGLVAGTSVAGGRVGAEERSLEQEFLSPPPSARPWAYWWWLNGHVTREGITRDLEAMEGQGIHGVLIFNAGGGATPPGLDFLGPEWRVLYRHALAEATRLGMEVSVNLCDGWDAGGPWITPECANKKLVVSEIQADGPGPVALCVPQPETLDGYYRDVAIVAFRDAPGAPVAPLRVSASSEVGGYCDEKNWPCADAVDRDPETVWRSGGEIEGGERWLLLEYAGPIAASAAWVVVPDPGRPCSYRIEASDDGASFRRLAAAPWRAAEQRIVFPETTARFFRLSVAGEADRTGIGECSWIWFPVGAPATSAPPGEVHLRREFALPAEVGPRVTQAPETVAPGGRTQDPTIARAVFTGTADNSFTLVVNGRPAGGNVGDPGGFHVLRAIDVTALLLPGKNVLAVTAENASTEANPAGFIGRLDVTLSDGRTAAIITDGSWSAWRDLPQEGWRLAGFDGRTWPAALEVAPYGGGPWGRPTIAAGNLDVAEVWMLRCGDEPRLRPGTKWWRFKSANRSFWDWPREGPAVLGEEYDGPDVCDARSAEVLDLTDRMRPDGSLQWLAAEGRWTVLRFGSTLLGQRTRCGSTVGGYEADMLDVKGIECHFKSLAEPLLDEAGDAVGRTLKFLHIDSYELGADVKGQQPTWSADFREEFRRRRGYDLLPYLPALARRVVDGRERTDRFLEDFRHTIGDLMAEEFFGRFAALAHARGVGVHCETGYGTYPHPHFDGLRCAGACDVTMGEFWHGTDIMSQFDPFCNVIRSVASAAHVYGRRIVQAEAFTSWDHFLEYPYALKAVGDAAFCDGLNRMVFHQYTHQPRSDVIPGWQYGAGTHIDRHVTWWPLAGAWFQYLARCQHLLQSGRFRADLCYFYGEGATRYVPGRDRVRPALPPGYDFDCVNAEVLLTRMRVTDGRLVLPDGGSYRILVLPETKEMSPTILRCIEKLLEAGATAVGPRPLRAPGLTDWPRCDEDVRAVADRLWGPDAPVAGDRRIGRGRLIWGRPLWGVLTELGIPPDFEVRAGARLGREAEPRSGERGSAGNGDPGAMLRFVHRTIEDAEVYFVSNPVESRARFECAFRVPGGDAELWDPVSGEILRPEGCRAEAGRTVVPLDLAPAQSCFVVFRDAVAEPGAAERARTDGPRSEPPHRPAFPRLRKVAEMRGPWEVSFDPRWGGPERTVFEGLTDWTESADAGVRYYSGRAVYRIAFDDAASAGGAGRAGRTYLDLGKVHCIARVRLNGMDRGVVWCAPWRVEITGALAPMGNRLEVEVINLWPNRLIGDAGLPPEKRLARTNVSYARDHPLLPSGLLGPVTIQAEDPAADR